MKPRTILLVATLSTLIFTGCQNNDLSAENTSLKQQITEMEQQITRLEQQVTELEQQISENKDNSDILQNNGNETSLQNNSNGQTTNTGNTTVNNPTTYTLEELSAMVDDFVVSVGSATPDVNNSGNLDQFFSLKREGDQIHHALENHENSLENQYRAGTISREEYRALDKDIELLEDTLDSALDRLEIAFGIDD